MSRPATSDRPVVRLRTPAEIVDAIPHLLGFTPERSLVVVALRGPRGRVGLTARVDLPDAEWAEECARQLVPHLERNGAWRVLVVAYPTEGGPADPAVRALADTFGDRLSRAGITMSDFLCVHAGRWWSLVCQQPACCPPEGTPLATGEVSVLGAAMAVEGRRPLPSRAALAGTLDPVGGPLGAAMAYALPRVDGQLAAEIWAGRGSQVQAESLELFRATVRRRVDGHMALTVDDAARLIVALDDLPVRDEVVTWFDGDWGAAARGLLAELVTRAAPPFHVVPLTVLGWIAYLQGDGTLGSLAVERALATDPGYGLARILDDALIAGVDPAVFRSLRGEMSAGTTPEAAPSDVCDE